MTDPNTPNSEDLLAKYGNTARPTSQPRSSYIGSARQQQQANLERITRRGTGYAPAAEGQSVAVAYRALTLKAAKDFQQYESLVKGIHGLLKLRSSVTDKIALGVLGIFSDEKRDAYELSLVEKRNIQMTEIAAEMRTLLTTMYNDSLARVALSEEIRGENKQHGRVSKTDHLQALQSGLSEGNVVADLMTRIADFQYDLQQFDSRIDTVRAGIMIARQTNDAEAVTTQTAELGALYTARDKAMDLMNADVETKLGKDLASLRAAKTIESTLTAYKHTLVLDETMKSLRQANEENSMNFELALRYMMPVLEMQAKAAGMIEDTDKAHDALYMIARNLEDLVRLNAQMVLKVEDKALTLTENTAFDQTVAEDAYAAILEGRADFDVRRSQIISNIQEAGQSTIRHDAFGGSSLGR